MALTTSGFQTPIELDDHFQKHGQEFGVQASTDYEILADEFLSGPVRPTHRVSLPAVLGADLSESPEQL